MVSKLLHCKAQTLVQIFKGRKMNRSCLTVCFATMRLLLNVSHVILQRFTIIARFIGFNLPSFATDILPSVSISVSNKCFFICNYFANSYDPYQILSVTQLFCCFWFCANCERPFRCGSKN